MEETTKHCYYITNAHDNLFEGSGGKCSGISNFGNEQCLCTQYIQMQL